VRPDKQSEKIKRARELAASPQVESNSRPPGVLDQIVEMMLPLATFSRFNFDARQLPIHPVDDTKHESREDSKPDAAHHKACGGTASNDETCNRNLVRRDSRFAKKRDQCGFNGRMEVSGHIERALLRGIQNDALRETMVLLARRRKTKWPHVPTHADDVIICRCCIDDVDATVVHFVFEFLKKWRSGRACQKEISCDQSRPARVLD